MKFKGLTILAVIVLITFLYVGSVKNNTLTFIETIIYFVESLCLSYLGAYVFYVLNVYLVERNERHIILPFVARNVFSIINNNHSIIKCLKLDAKLSLSVYPDEEEFKLLLSNIDPTNNAPYYYKNQSWLYLLRNRRKTTIEAIDKIILSGKHLDVELRSILLEIQSSLYLREDYAFNSESFTENRLEKYHLLFFDYFFLISKLNAFYNKKLHNYTSIKNFLLK